MALLRSCGAEHDIAGVGPVDGNREVIGGQFQNATCDRNYITSGGLPRCPTHQALVWPLL